MYSPPSPPHGEHNSLPRYKIIVDFVWYIQDRSKDQVGVFFLIFIKIIFLEIFELYMYSDWKIQSKSLPAQKNEQEMKNNFKPQICSDRQESREMLSMKIQWNENFFSFVIGSLYFFYIAIKDFTTTHNPTVRCRTTKRYSLEIFLFKKGIKQL